MNIDGAEIFVEKLPGTGNLNSVLIHNAGSDHRFFTHQLEILRQFGNVIQLDLPGSEGQTIQRLDLLILLVG